MVFILILSLTFLLWSFLGIIEAQAFEQALGFHQYMGAGGGTIGTATGTTSLIQSSKQAKKNQEFYHRIGVLENENTAQDGRKEILDRDLQEIKGDVKAALEKIDEQFKETHKIQLLLASKGISPPSLQDQEPLL